MTLNPFDQACRYLLRLDAVGLLAWLLRLPPAEVDFVDWVDTRQVPWPGQPGRTCDTVAHLRDRSEGGRPWAVVVEFQAEPDELMFGRGLAYLGELWQACKPTGHRGDRFEVGLVVVNLTGVGRASRRMRLAKTGLRTTLGAPEWNLATLPARRLLRQIEAGEVPRSALTWVPLFQGGDQPGILKKWRQLAEQETDKERRKTLGLATVFAEATGCGEMWREALKEWDVIESKIVKEWTAQARKEGVKEGIKKGIQEGKIEGAVEALLDVLETRFAKPPADLAKHIQGCNDLDQLRRWTRQASKAPSLAQFRQDAGL